MLFSNAIFRKQMHFKREDDVHGSRHFGKRCVLTSSLAFADFELLQFAQYSMYIMLENA